ncbi:MAG TPA: hypothetical protein VMZ33_00545 [Candidatus Limnocylindrales bacterium]|nr:hypothetical protein [Candidatus Limnocylindrales bacterium]
MDELTGKVMTVTGAVDPAALGVTDAHDHLFLASHAMPGQEFQDSEKAIEEVRTAQAGGLATIVDLTPIGLGRRPDLLRQVSDATGLRVVGATGFHRDEHYPDGHWALEATDDVLSVRMLTDIREGMHPTDWVGGDLLDSARAGVIKLGASYQHISRQERRRLEVGGVVSAQTGVSVFVHTEVGTVGDEIVDVLLGAGVGAERIVLAHLDRNPDWEWHAELLSRGISVVYDTPGRTKYFPDSTLLGLIENVLAAGFGDRVMLGLDLGRRDYYKAYGGGPGLGYLMERFVPRLEKRVGTHAAHQILVANPARVLAVSPIA